MPFYSLHAPIQRLLHKQTLAQLPVVEAIRQHISLLLTTRLEEYRYDPAMGCSIWQDDFTNIINGIQWKSDAEQTITNLIIQYEKRIRQTQVQVEIDEPADQSADGTIVRIRRRITITVGGTLVGLDEPMPEQTFIMFFSPVATV